MPSAEPRIVISNIQTFLDIAVESIRESERLSREQRRPKDDGTPGSIITFDPTRRSFKHALIAVVFSAAYLEALLHLEGYKQLGPAEYEKIDYSSYKQKLEKLGITDTQLLDASERLRENRKALLHEKAGKEAMSPAKEIKVAQTEARNAIKLVVAISEFFRSQS